MNAITSWWDTFVLSFQNLWLGFVEFLPKIIGALIVFIIGWIVAEVLARIVETAIKFLRIDQLLEKIGTKKIFERANIELNTGKFLGQLAKWFLIIVFLMTATDILGLPQVTDFLKSVLYYIPQIVIAAIILIVAVLVANFVYKVVKGSIEAAGLAAAGAIAAIAKWAILLFAFFAALMQLQIAVFPIQTLFTGVVFMLALAGGLAFGIGGKEHASKILDKISKELGGE